MKTKLNKKAELLYEVSPVFLPKNKLLSDSNNFDFLFAPVVNDVKENNNFTTENIRMLIFLAYLSKWRVLNYDQSFSAAKRLFFG